MNGKKYDVSNVFLIQENSDVTIVKKNDGAALALSAAERLRPTNKIIRPHD
jgi:hypothetical protein